MLNLQDENGDSELGGLTEWLPGPDSNQRPTG